MWEEGLRNVHDWIPAAAHRHGEHGMLNMGWCHRRSHAVILQAGRKHSPAPGQPCHKAPYLKRNCRTDAHTQHHRCVGTTNQGTPSSTSLFIKAGHTAAHEHVTKCDVVTLSVGKPHGPMIRPSHPGSGGPPPDRTQLRDAVPLHVVCLVLAGTRSNLTGSVAVCLLSIDEG